MLPCAGSSPSSCSRRALESSLSRPRTHRPPTTSTASSASPRPAGSSALVQLRERSRSRTSAARWSACAGSWFRATVLQRPAPALNRFDEEYHGRGLVVIGVYHHKDLDPLDLETVRGYVEHYQFRFPVAVDPDWQTSEDARSSTATAVVDERQLLVDRRGVIRSRRLGGKLDRHRRLPRHPREDRCIARRGSLTTIGQISALHVDVLTHGRIERLDRDDCIIVGLRSY